MAESLCRYYFIHKLVMPSKLIGPSRPPSSVAHEPRCSHPHSIYDGSPRHMGSEKLITCEGDLKRCVVPIEHRYDLEP